MSILRALRRRRLATLGLMAAVAALTYSLVAGAATPIPVPEPLVKVTTKSGVVTKTHYVPIGGAPIPIDVDGPAVTGILEPDVDVSVGLVALEELPGKPIVPNVVVTRNALAVASNRPAPPLDFDAQIVLRDLNDSLRPFVTVHYGFKTPGGARVPQRLSAKLVGPITGGFIDPLQAKIEAPGYSGPLDLKISALTHDLDAKFNLSFDSLPESIFISEDPREDGLDVLYEHDAPVNDVHLDAFATLRNRTNNELLEVGAQIERLPQRITLANTNTANGTEITYDSSSALSKPDLTARYRDLEGDGDVVTDAKIDVAGLPFKMGGKLTTVPNDDGGSDLDAVDFRVENGDQIDGVDFEVRNFDGPAGVVPAPVLNPEQHIAIASRFVDGRTRSRAAGRLLGIRSATFERQGPANDTIDATTDLGDGVRPLRALLDIDNRNDPSVPDDEDQSLVVDTTLSPLPEQIHAIYDPSANTTDPLRLFYESSRSLDIDATAVIATADGDGCGQPLVTCAKARIDDVPTELEALLPGQDGTDFSLRHDGTAVESRPDVTAVVDTTNVDDERTYAEVRIDRVPPKVDGRLDTKNEVLRAAEFHGCDFDFAPAVNKCVSPATADALGRVRFTVRDRPERGDLPAREDTAKQFVSLIQRHERMEAVGRVDEVRNVVFHQRDDNEDGVADGTLGALVDAGTGGPFDAVIDTVTESLDPDDDTEPFTVLGDESSKMRIGVEALPQEFSACVRSNAETPVPDPGSLSPDPLLAPCDEDEVLGRDAGELDTTPLSILYKASSKTKVSARIATDAPEKPKADPTKGYDDPKNRSAGVFATTVDKVPAEIRADVIAPITPEPDATPAVAGRKLELDYGASERIGRIDFEMETRQSDSLCEDPRPAREATCLSAAITDLPSDINVSFDPDDSKGDIVFKTAAPKESGGQSCTNGGDDDGDGQGDATDPDCKKLSINKPDVSNPDPMRLSIVQPDPTASPLVLDARITDISDEIRGKLISKDVDGEGGLGPSKCTNGVDDDSDAGDAGGGTDANDDDCEKDLAQMVFNACPTGTDIEVVAAGCDGIGAIEFKATNALVGDPVPQPSPSTASIGGVTQDFSFVQREDLFRAQGKISKLKKIGLSQVDKSPQANPSATTRIGAAFGSGLPSEKIRAYVDTDSGAEQLQADAIIAEAPSGIEVCLRDAIPGGSDFAPNAASDIFCDTAAGNQFALQAALAEKATTDKPDIDIRKLRVASGGGTSVLTGTAKIDNLGERIDVLAGKQDADGDILVEGHELGDDNHAPSTSDPDNVADRITFDIRNRDADPSGGSQFPWQSLENADPNPVDDVNTVDVDSPAGLAANDGNYLKFMTDAAGRFKAKGSVPDIKRIAKREGACDPTDPRYPLTGFSAAKLPTYSCMVAAVAGDKKLGLGVRTLDDKNEVLEVEEGLITRVPSGGLKVTMAKSPDAAKLDPICSASQGANCRPPMLSLEAPRGGGSVPRLHARLSTGAKDLIVGKMLREKPADVSSKNLDYEDAPSQFPEPGARVKVGTDKSPAGEDRVGIRLNANLPLHQYLDLDPPTLWSCVHSVSNPNPETDCAASPSDASSDANKGYESKDIFFKLVAADNHHGGSDVASLGRIAVLIQDYKAGGTETVLTGTPTPDNKTWFEPRAGTDFEDQYSVPSTVQGADSHFPENLTPASDPSHRGFLVPGHLDAKVYLRNDYHATDDKKQQNYAQVDGRINRPLSLAVRLNDGTETNRAGQAVPPTQLTIRNAPSSNGTDNYGVPTFRVRAELKKDKVDLSEPGLAENVFTCRGEGYGIEIPAFLTVCLILPTKSQAHWLDVALNMDPQSNGTSTTGNAARTVDAVAGPFGGSNDADLRGFRDVNGSGGDPEVNKGPGAGITPQAGIRLDNFKIGLKVGAGFFGLFGGSVTYQEEGDLVVGLTGEESERARLNHNLLVMSLSGGTTSHKNRIQTNLKSIFRLKVTAEALFGLVEEDVINETIGPFHHDVIFRDCEGNFLALGGQVDQFRSPDPGILDEGEQAAIALGLTDEITGDVASAFSNILTGIGSQVFCLFTTSESKDVNANHPAPRYSTSRGVEDGPTAQPLSGQGDPPVASDPAAEPSNVTIAASTVRCGTIEAKTLTIPAGVTVTVGDQDLDNDGNVNGSPAGFVDADDRDPVTGAACDGRLNIDAQDVIVHGAINASGARDVSAGPGAGGQGGGGGHAGAGGGRGGFGEPGGGAAYAVPAGGPFEDFGSAGGNGFGSGVSGGRGGGVIRIAAADDVTISGSVLARGTAGANAGGACNDSGGGGGSGGAIEISGSRVVGGGTVSVSGGGGGSGPRGGGGGSAGRLTINRVVDGANMFFASRGTGGTASANCDGSGGVDTGGNGFGAPGTAIDPPGQDLDRAATVKLVSATNPGPFVKGTVALRVSGVQDPASDPDDRHMDIVVCRKYLDPQDTVAPFEDPALDPGNASLEDRLDDDSCSVQEFDAPTSGTDRYDRTINVPLNLPVITPGDGFYSWYAIAAQRPEDIFGDKYDDDDHCLDPSHFFLPECDFQSPEGSGSTDDVLLPQQASARIGSDTVAPTYDTPAANRQLNGFVGCPDGSLCLPEPKANLKVEASDGTSGIDTVTCTVNGSGFGAQDCTPAGSVELDVGNASGLKTVDMRLEDRADDLPADPVGNVRNLSGVAKWFTDKTVPNKPVVTMNACSGGENGWCTTFPTFSVSGSDDNPSSGYDAGGLTVLIDEAGQECGAAAAGSSSNSGSTGIACTSASIPPITQEGRHVISAFTTDRLGNESPRADSKFMKVDNTAPESAMALGPKKPDGAEVPGENWWRTKPFFAFAASDKAGGSGVDRSFAVSGIFYSVNGDPFAKFDPNADLRLPDGIHQICWYAVDVAGNQESTECRSGIKVDSTAPTVNDPISPAAPDGSDGWYVTSPSANGTSSDPAGAASAAQRSGVAKVQMSVDDGDWFTAAPTSIAEGTHTVRTRSFDVAGNPSPILERRVFVDRSNPSATLVSFPPAPNSRSWFRRHVTDSVAVSDGRDGSGPAGATFSVNTEGPSSYLAPFTVPHGINGVGVRARDTAGRQGALVQRTQKIDTKAPAGVPVGQTPLLTLPAIGLPNPVALKFSATNELPGQVRVQVFVQDTLGTVVRRLDAGWRAQGSGEVKWNGRDSRDRGVLPGVYTYRVHVTDEAGNTVLGTESKPFVVVLGLLPL